MSSQDNQPIPEHVLREAAAIIERELRERSPIGKYDLPLQMEQRHGITRTVYDAVTRVLFPRLGVTQQNELLVVPSLGTFPMEIGPTPYQQRIRRLFSPPRGGTSTTLRRWRYGITQ